MEKGLSDRPVQVRARALVLPSCSVSDVVLQHPNWMIEGGESEVVVIIGSMM